jgi:phospholipase/carboxylesterase
MVMRAWYDILAMDISSRADVEGVLKSEKQILELIDEQIAQGFKYEQIILAGFSQGSAMSLHVATRLQDKIAGIIALSGYVPVADLLLKEKNQSNIKTPIFMGHGTQDPVVPYALGESSRELLIKAGYQIDWHHYPIQHGVSMDEIMDIKQWIINKIKN